METLSIKEFAAKSAITQIVPVVRLNTNKYPYITFIDKDNKAENIYFSKAASALVAEGQAVTKELLSTLQVATVLNANQEERLKLISNSERVDIDSLLN